MRKGSHTVSRLTCHIVWVTKYRFHVLKGDIQHRCKDLIIQVCDVEEVQILKGVVSKDHIHIHIEYPPRTSISQLVKRMKGRTSRMLQKEFPKLKHRYWGRHFWATGYGAWSTGNITDEMDKEISVNMVNDGQQMLYFLADEKNLLPHIIFLDLNMPNMNGIECLKEIRRHEKYSDISVVIYSTSTSEKDIDDTFRHGANIYITKPAAYRDLKEVLEKSLSAVRLNQNSDLDMVNFVLKI